MSFVLTMANGARVRAKDREERQGVEMESRNGAKQ